ncbi:MAG: nuclease [Herminiimonas sp.]|nr:nuclease [Herminiimonas sp.]
MAQIYPTGWQEVDVTGAALREIETLRLLDRALADAPYSIYHGVHWTNIHHGFSAYGEIDFILVAPNGRVLLIEQKSGFLTETPDGLVKSYQGREKNIQSQIQRTIQGLLARFGRAGQNLWIDYLLYCPDYLVKNPLAAGVHPERIIDAGNKGILIKTIRQLLPVGEAVPELTKIQRFFGDILSLKPDPSAMIGHATELVTRLSGGLGIWARRLEFSPYRLRVTGTAGSGKTQLALAEYSAAVEAGLRPLYVCYNRPLADHVQQLVPQGGRVGSFHHLCDALARACGMTPDYGSPSVWEELERLSSSAPLPADWQYDVLIVDEGQDFSESWRDIVLRMLKPEGRAIWLEDPLQNLYGRAPVSLPGWVTLHSQTNFRSPRQIIDMLISMSGAAGSDTPSLRAIEAASPILGADIDIHTWADGDVAAMVERTKQAITGCLAAGFTRQDIALISFRGRDNSALLNLDALGAHRLKSFTGEYDLFGNPVFREGELLAESVYRFKGQSAPAVVFTEIDFEAMDERTCRKLFVGMTRARLKLTLVLSERSARCLLGSGDGN